MASEHALQEAWFQLIGESAQKDIKEANEIVAMGRQVFVDYVNYVESFEDRARALSTGER